MGLGKIGSLLILLSTVQVIVAQANGIQNQFMFNPREEHSECVPNEGYLPDRSLYTNETLDLYGDLQDADYANNIDRNTFEQPKQNDFDVRRLLKNLMNGSNAIHEVDAIEIFNNSKNFLIAVKTASLSLGRLAGAKFVHYLASQPASMQDNGPRGVIQAKKIGHKIAKRLATDVNVKLHEMYLLMKKKRKKSVASTTTTSAKPTVKGKNRKRRDLYADGTANENYPSIYYNSDEEEGGAVFGQEITAMLDDLEPLTPYGPSYEPDLDRAKGENLMDMIYSGYVGSPHYSPPDSVHDQINAVHLRRRRSSEGQDSAEISANQQITLTADGASVVSASAPLDAGSAGVAPISEPVSIKIDLGGANGPAALQIDTVGGARAHSGKGHRKSHHSTSAPSDVDSGTTTTIVSTTETSASPTDETQASKAAETTTTTTTTNAPTPSIDSAVAGESRADLSDLGNGESRDILPTTTTGKPSTTTSTTTNKPNGSSTTIKPNTMTSVSPLPDSYRGKTPLIWNKMTPAMRDLYMQRLGNARTLMLNSAKMAFNEGIIETLGTPLALSLKPDSLFLRAGLKEGFEEGLITGWIHGNGQLVDIDYLSWKDEEGGNESSNNESVRGKAGRRDSFDRVLLRAGLVDLHRPDPYDVGVDIGYGLGAIFGYNVARKPDPSLDESYGLISLDKWANNLNDRSRVPSSTKSAADKRANELKQRMSAKRAAYEMGSLAAFRVALRAGFVAGIAFGPQMGLCYVRRAGARIGAKLGANVGAESGLKAGGDTINRVSLNDQVYGSNSFAKKLADVTSMVATDVGLKCGSSSGRSAGTATGALAAIVGFHAYVDNSGTIDALNGELRRFEAGAMRGFKLGHATGLSIKINKESPSYIDPLTMIDIGTKCPSQPWISRLPKMNTALRNKIRSMDDIRQDSNKLWAKLKTADGNEHKVQLEARSWSIDTTNVTRIYFKINNVEENADLRFPKPANIVGYLVGTINQNTKKSDSGSRASGIESTENLIEKQEKALDDLYKNSRSGQLSTQLGVTVDSSNGELSLNNNDDSGSRSLLDDTQQVTFMKQIYEPVLHYDETPSTSLESIVLDTAIEPKLPGQDTDQNTTEKPAK